jgi:hypothetical protein
MLYYDDWCSLTETDKEIKINVNVTAEDIDRANKFLTKLLASAATERAAKYLGSKPVFCMSGGIDSQAAYQLWDKRFPIDVVIFKFANDLNINEVNDAVRYVTAHNIDYELVTLDLERFLTFHLLDFAKKNSMLSPQFATHAFFLDHLRSQGYTGAVLGGNGFVIEEQKLYFNLSSAQLLDLEYYGIKNNINIIPSFLSFDRDLSLKLALNTPINFDPYTLSIDWEILPKDRRLVLNRETRYANKIKSYQNLNLSLIPQDDKKTGFEQVKDYYAEKYSDLWTFEKHFRWPLSSNRLDKEVITSVPTNIRDKILHHCGQISSTDSGKNLERSKPGSLMSRQFL